MLLLMPQEGDDADLRVRTLNESLGKCKIAELVTFFQNSAYRISNLLVTLDVVTDLDKPRHLKCRDVQSRRLVPVLQKEALLRIGSPVLC